MNRLTDVKAINDGLTEGSESRLCAGAGSEQIPDGGCEFRRIRVILERRFGFSAAKTEHDLLAGSLAASNVFLEVGAGEKSSGTRSGHFRGRSTTASGAEVDGRVASGTVVFGEEG